MKPDPATSPDHPTPKADSSRRRMPLDVRLWSWRRRVVVMVALLLALWGAAVATTALSTRTALRDAEAQLLEARRLLQDGEVEQAREALTKAGQTLSASRADLHRPDMALAAAVPWLGRDLDVARTMVTAADDVVTKAGAALDAASVLADGDLGEEGLPVAQIEAFAPTLRDAADATLTALAQIRATPRAFTAEVNDGRTRVLELLGPIADQLTVAADLVEVLPGFLGADGPRRYLVGAANPAEMRGIGGYLGSYTILTVRDGRLDFGTFVPLSDRPDLVRGDIPVDVLAPRYEEFGGTWRWKNTNMTPDMPSAARALTLMWARQTGQALDGVLIVDPFALETMLRVTGPVTTADGSRLDADTAVAYLTNGAYADFDNNDLRKEVTGDAAKVVLQEFLGRGSDLVDRAGDLGRLITERQLLLYAADPATQRAFSRAGMDGGLPDPEGDMLAVVVNSASNSKIDYYLRRSIAYEVELSAGGAATGILALTFRNEAPLEGQPRYVLGPNVDGIEVGDNQFHLSTYCATTCVMNGAVGGLSGRSRISTELGHPVAGAWALVPAGDATSFEYSTTTQKAWAWEDGDLVYRLLLRTQTSVNAPSVTVTVAIPDGFRFSGGTSGILVENGSPTYQTERRGDVVLEFRFAPA